MGIISVEQVNRLYWLGRYTERVYTTVRMYIKSFDTMIDKLADIYEEFCEMIDIPNIYTSSEDFMKRYPFDTENSDSIFSNLNRAYDNAIVLRESITSEALAFIQLAIYDMNRAKESQAPLIELQQLMDHILAFWGIVDDQIDSKENLNIIKIGKRIERIDLYARLGVSKDELRREVHRMVPRVMKSGISYDEGKLELIYQLVEAPELDYGRIAAIVENII